MLQKRASPKFDVESIRNSDKRDLWLVISETFPETLPARSQQVMQICEHYRERDKCLTTRGLNSLMVTMRTMLN